MRRTTIAVAVATAGLAIAGCGGSTSTVQHGRPHTTPDPQVWTQAALVQKLRLTSHENDLYWTDPSGCQVIVILTSPEMVATYDGDGSDDVVTNVDGSVGVKFMPEQTGCFQKLANDLRLVGAVPGEAGGKTPTVE